MASTWIKSAVFYEIYPNSFMDADGDGYGDFKGITSKLDHIKSLGCNAIWLNPHYDSPFMDGGYDVRDHFKVSERFGTEADFDEMLAAAHAKGIKVILDLVPGHASEQNADFLKSAEPVKNELSDRFIWTDDVWRDYDGVNCIGGRHDRNGKYVVNFFATQPALNYGYNRIDHPEWQLPYTSDAARSTREWLKRVMRFWLDRGADGFRVDMADSLVKNDGDRNEKPATSELWRDIRAMLDKEYPDCVLVSEWSDPQAARAGFHVDFMLENAGDPYNLLVRGDKSGKRRAYFDPAGGDAKAFADGFSDWYKQVEGAGGSIGLITCNHDTPRLAPVYSHEQLKLIYATLFTLPGVPFVYYGDELGMKYIADLPSVECGFDRTGSRTPMQWSMEKNAGFSNAEQTFLPTFADKQTNVVAQQKDKKSLLNFFKEFFAFRRAHKEFINGGLEFLHAVGSEPLVYKRGALTVAVNPRKTKQTAPVTLPPKVKAIFSVGKEAKAQKTCIALPPLSFTVFGEK